MMSEILRAVRDAGPIDADVHAWGVHVGPLRPSVGDAAAVLCDEEMERMERLHSSLHRDRYALVHAVMRGLLAGYLDRAPAELIFRRRRSGKPYLVDNQRLNFNLSHSGDILALGVTRAGEIGIDVEIDREIPDLDLLARSVLSSREYVTYGALPRRERRRRFLQCWTRKEAFAKAIGSGLGELPRAEIPLGPSGEWKTHDISWSADCYAALTVRSRSARIRFLTFPASRDRWQRATAGRSATPLAPDQRSDRERP